MDEILLIKKFYNNVDNLIITDTEIVTKQFLSVMEPSKETSTIIEYALGDVICRLGVFNEQSCIHIQIPPTFQGVHCLSVVLSEFKIENVIILGMAGGINSSLGLGDVLIADSIVNIKKEKLENSFSCTQINSVSQIFLEKSNIIENCKASFQENVHIGALGTTNMIVGDKDIIKQINRKILALDMECYDLYELFSLYKIEKWFVVKGIVDLVDTKKNDQYQIIAIKNCLKVCWQLIFDIKKEDTLLHNKKTIFISSTCYDLADIRSELAFFLKNYGKKVLWSESPDFPVDFYTHSHDICLDNVKKSDQLILIIDKRYGGIYAGNKYPKENISITQYEVKIAMEMQIPIITFVRNTVWTERAIYKHNLKKEIKISPFYVDSIKVFELIDFILHSKSNWIYQFENSLDLKLKLKTILGL